MVVDADCAAQAGSALRCGGTGPRPESRHAHLERVKAERECVVEPVVLDERAQQRRQVVSPQEVGQERGRLGTAVGRKRALERNQPVAERDWVVVPREVPLQQSPGLGREGALPRRRFLRLDDPCRVLDTAVCARSGSAEDSGARERDPGTHLSAWSARVTQRSVTASKSDVMSTSSTRPAWNAWSKLPSWVNSATTESGSRWKPAEASHGQPSTANGTGRREATHWSARARGTRPRAASATARGSTPCGGRRARALREAATPRPGRTRPRGCAAPPCVACGPGRAQSRQYSLDYARVHGRRKGRRTRSLSSPATTAIQAWSFETSESALVAAR